MTVLYSEGSRKLLLDKSKSWNKKIILFKILAHILKKKYLRTDNVAKDYAYFDKIRPEFILEQLYKHNGKKFYDTKLFDKGFFSSLYISKFYKLLGTKLLFLDYISDKLFYSMHNNVEMIPNTIRYNTKEKSLATILKHFENPDVIIIRKLESYNLNMSPYYPSHYNLTKLDEKYMSKKTYNSLYSLARNVTYNDEKYTQDSVILNNWNIWPSGKSHSIAGITC